MAANQSECWTGKYSSAPTSRLSLWHTLSVNASPCSHTDWQTEWCCTWQPGFTPSNGNEKPQQTALKTQGAESTANAVAEFSPNYEASNESYHSLKAPPKKTKPQTAKAMTSKSLVETLRLINQRSSTWSEKKPRHFNVYMTSFKVYPYFLTKQQHKQCVHHIEIFIILLEGRNCLFRDYWHKYLFLYCQPTNSKESSLKLWQVPGRTAPWDSKHGYT